MRSFGPLALGILFVSVLGVVATPTASAQDLKCDPATATAVELTLTEQGSETPWLAACDQVTLVIPDLKDATVVEVPEGLFVDQTSAKVTVEPGGSTYTINEVVDGSYVVTTIMLQTPLIGTINVSSTKKPR